MKKEHIIPKEMQAAYDEWHYSPGLKVGQTVYISGQVGIDEQGEIPEGVAEQTDAAFQNLKKVVEEAGGALENVVALNTFHVGIHENLAPFQQVKDKYFPDGYPAWTAVGVPDLALPACKVEIQAIAVID